MVFDDYKKQEGQIITGTIQRVESRKILIDLGKITGIVPAEQQIPSEFYRRDPGWNFCRFRGNDPRGPEIILSRNSVGIIKEIFRRKYRKSG